MTAPFDLKDVQPERYSTDEEIGVPNFKAASGETGDPPRLFTPGSNKESRPGLFGVGRAGIRKPRAAKPKTDVPRLAPMHRQKLGDFYRFIGASIRPFDEFTGDVIIEQADACAKSVFDLAQENESFRRAIIAFTTTSMTGAVVMAHLPIVLALARHSRNTTVKGTAAATFIALKMGTPEQAESAFGEPDDNAE